MVTAVDSSVLLDVVFDDPRYGRASAAALRQARAEGSLVVSECVVAEIGPALEGDRLVEFLNDWGIQFLPSSIESAMLAGNTFRRYLSRGGRRGRIVPDFLVGAHGQKHADRLLARDRGFYRDYFSGLSLWDPSKPQRQGA
jgi:predicted nucleic acid-binding protein